MGSRPARRLWIATGSRLFARRIFRQRMGSRPACRLWIAPGLRLFALSSGLRYGPRCCPPVSLLNYAARGTVTETVVPGDARGCGDSTAKLPRQRLDNARAEGASRDWVSQVCADPHA